VCVCGLEGRRGETKFSGDFFWRGKTFCWGGKLPGHPTPPV